MFISLVPQRIDTRIDMNALGVDYGSDARVLAVTGLTRLVWAKGTKTLIGIRGFGHTVSPSSLQVRTHKRIEDGRIVYGGSSDQTLFEGGRLSKARLLEVKPQIDAIFGDGVTERLDPRATLLLDGQDELAAWLEARRIQLENERMSRWRNHF